MVLVNPLHEYFRQTHLDLVVERMKVLGPPRIRAHFDGEIWHATEGTHRLRAARILGIVPMLIPVPWTKSRKALRNARFAAMLRAHSFDRVDILPA
jgi:hypothetical protein